MFKKEDFKDIRMSNESFAYEMENIDAKGILEEKLADIEVEILEQPIVNGINLREHPTPQLRIYFNSVLDSGGQLGLLIDKGKKSAIILINKKQTTKQAMNKFGKQRAVNIINDLLKSNLQSVEYKGRKIFRPKSLTPDDFWEQFPKNEYLAIIAHSDMAADIADINSRKNRFNLSSRKIVNFCARALGLGLISQETYETLYGE